MKLKRNAWRIIGALASAIVLMSCSSGGGGGDDPAGGNYEITDRPLTPLTMANLAGTWWKDGNTLNKRDLNDNLLASGVGRITDVINQDGTYLRSTQYHMVSVSDPLDTWEMYEYEEGAISCDSNTITRTRTGTIAPSETPIGDPDTAAWSPENYITSRTSVICNNRLYMNAFHRVGTGSGINGTWQAELTSGSLSAVHRVVITDTTYTEYTGQNVDSLSLHASATYTRIADNTLHVSSDPYDEYDMEVILCGDMLVMLNMSENYTRQ